MLPRKQSIFHLAGEESGAINHRACLSGAVMTGGVRRARERERLVVGLQIVLVHQQHHHGRRAHAASIVLKQVVRPRAAVTHSFQLMGCYLCKRELSANKDVYMYRGDQGFCSEECRCRQIMVDEREAAVKSKERQRRWNLQARHHSPHHTPIRSGGLPRMTTLAAVA